MKRVETTFGKQMFSHMFAPQKATAIPLVQPPRPSSRHKRHADTMAPNKLPSSLERKPRKRRTLERVGASVVSVYFVCYIVKVVVGVVHWFLV